MTGYREAVRCRYQDISRVSVRDIVRMHEIFVGYYDNVELEVFLGDMGKKTGVFIMRAGDGAAERIVGFSTIMHLDLSVEGRRARGIFSGDTIVERQFWGSRSLQRAFVGHVIRQRLANPFRPLYWFLISKGYKTYLLLARNFPEFHPQRGTPQPALESLVIDYCEALFPGKLNRQTMVLEFGEDANRLKADVAVITDEMRERDADIRFFESRNPTWQQGTELPCIARADLAAFSRAIVPFLWKVLKQRVAGKPAAQVAQPRSA